MEKHDTDVSYRHYKNAMVPVPSLYERSVVEIRKEKTDWRNMKYIEIEVEVEIKSIENYSQLSDVYAACQHWPENH